jgi:hypothetical protein
MRRQAADEKRSSCAKSGAVQTAVIEIGVMVRFCDTNAASRN